MIAYASRTGTRRNLAALRARGWRLLVSAAGVLRHEGFPYMLDNGAWSSFTKGEPFDVARFMRALDWAQRQAWAPDSVVVPDIVGGGAESLSFSLSWIPRLGRARLLLLPVQDGMHVDDVRPHLSGRIGIFLGGTTEWKIDTMRQWGQLARSAGCWYHVGRVNSVRRIRYCQDAGADSFDGSSASRFALSLPKLDHGRRQVPLWGSI